MKRKTFNILMFIKKTRSHRNGLSPVYVRITLNGLRAEFATQNEVDPAKWDEKIGMVKCHKQDHSQVNDNLVYLKSKLNEIKCQLEMVGELSSPFQIRDRFQGIERAAKTILQLFKEHNDDCKKLQGIDFSPATVQRYHTCMNHVATYIRQAYHRNNVTLEEIKPEFIRGFELFLKTEKMCEHNTAVKYLKNFKKIIRIALANGYMKNDPFANIRFKLNEVDKPFLTNEEIALVMNKKLHFERLERVRDVFVFGCFTGLAYSDIKALKETDIEEINHEKWIVVRRKKTNQVCHIPLLKPAEDILIKYSKTLQRHVTKCLLPVPSNQKMNAYLKEIADLCGIEKNIGTHVARHTFATTVTLGNDLPLEVVSKMLGHSSIQMTKRYARVTTELIQKNVNRIRNVYV